MIKTICVAGAGTMGSGIALTAAQAGFAVVLFDTNEKGIDNAKIGINKNLDFLLSKEKITTTQKENIFTSILFTTNINDCVGEKILRLKKRCTKTLLL
jgi:3-hydroxybutyryl-CoA dehydrogenase